MSHAKWIQKLSRACGGDLNHAKSEFEWLRKKLLSDSRGKYSKGNFTPIEILELEELISRRVDSHEPLQYILGSQPFLNLDIKTKAPTLIPRWETEEWTYKLIKMLGKELSKTKRKLKILDACTGTGCIALALARHLPKDSVEIMGVDISERAVNLANENKYTHDYLLKNPVQFEKNDLLKDSPTAYSKYHLIVSNPPYITTKDYESLEPVVKNWEDPRALVAGEEGTDFHSRLLRMALNGRPFGPNVPRLVMEIGSTSQAEFLTKKAAQTGLCSIQIWKDQDGKDRVISAR